MTKLFEKLQGFSPEVIGFAKTTVISISSQHIFCSNCDSNSELVSSLTFTFSDIDGVKSFTLPPASNIELNQLAVMFGTSHSFSSRIVFNSLPGFEISILQNSESTIRVSFLADTQLLRFMGLSQACASVNSTVAISELPALEQAIRSASKLCK